MCRAARNDGTRIVVATPHVNWDYPDVTAAVIQDKVAAVNHALRTAGIDVTVRTGAEVALSRAGELSDLELTVLALGGGPYVMLEFPWTSALSGAVNALRAFARRGHGIVLAHPERTPALRRDQTLVRDLVQSGVLCCLDVGSLTERANRGVRAAAWQMLADGLVHAIASDAHDTARRPPELAGALASAGLSALEVQYFTRDSPEAIINGGIVASPPRVRDRRRRGLGRRRS
jgi:protein-tyrosine phosphatase